MISLFEITQPSATLIGALVGFVGVIIVVVYTKFKDRRIKELELTKQLENKERELEIQKQNNIEAEKHKQQQSEFNEIKKKNKEILDKILSDFIEIDTNFKSFPSLSREEYIKLIKKTKEEYCELNKYIKKQTSNELNMQELSQSLVKLDIPITKLINYYQDSNSAIEKRMEILIEVNNNILPIINKEINKLLNLAK